MTLCLRRGNIQPPEGFQSKKITEENEKMRRDDWTSAAALYDGGWRAEDRDELVAEYNLSEEEADAICEDLRRMDEKEG